MLTWASKLTDKLDAAAIAVPSHVYTHTLADKSRSLPSTSARQRASKKCRPSVRPTNFKTRDGSLLWRRKARASMHCVHMGPQELAELLAGHESVGRPLLQRPGLYPPGHVDSANGTTDSQFSPMKSRHSRRSLPAIKSSRRAIPSCSGRRRPTPAGSRACPEARRRARACVDMRRSSRSTYTTSWPSWPSIASTRNSMVRLLVARMHCPANMDRNVRV
jgi:hypothetical protein